MVFDPKRYLIKVQGGRAYLPVSARLIWFRGEHPDWGIETDPLVIDTEKQFAIFRAKIYNGEGKLMAIGTKKEDILGFGDYIEKAETGAIGRALALCGYGTQFSPELDEVTGGRLTDSPQPMGRDYRGGNRYDGGSRHDRSTDWRGRAGHVGEDGVGDTYRDGIEAAESPMGHQPSDDDDAEFRAVVSGSDLLPVLDDPFEDRSLPTAPSVHTQPGTVSDPAQHAAPPAPKENGTASVPNAPPPPACVECGKTLTKAQMELSVRNFGEALCPGCQKERSKAGRASA